MLFFVLTLALQANALCKYFNHNKIDYNIPHNNYVNHKLSLDFFRYAIFKSSKLILFCSIYSLISKYTLP